MKKTKILIPIISTLALGTSIVPTLASCSRNKQEDKKTTYTIAFDGGEHGTVAKPSTPVVAGTLWKDVEKPAVIPHDDYNFDQWVYVNTEKAGQPVGDNDAINTNVQVKATYKIKQCTLTIETDGNGAVDKSCIVINKNTVWGEAKTKLIATPNQAYKFKSWQKDNIDLTDNFPITTNFTVKATFEKDTALKCDVTIQAGEHGKVLTSTIQVNAWTKYSDAKETLQAAVVGDDDYIFEKFVDSKGNDIPDTYEFTDNVTIKAIFMETPETAISSFQYEISGDNFNITKFIGTETEVKIPSTLTQGNKEYSIGYVMYDAFANNANVQAINLNKAVFRTDAHPQEPLHDLVNVSKLSVSPDNTLFTCQDNCILSKDKKILYQGCKTSIIPYETEEIYDQAFYGNQSLENLDVNGVTKIGSSSFKNCSNLKTVDLKKVTSIWGDSIQYNSFEGCNNIESITMINNASVKVEGNCLLSGDGKTLLTGCKNSVIPESVEIIGLKAFTNITSLTSIDFNKVKTVKQSAFEGCTGLTELDLKEVTTLGSHAFAYCSELTQVNLGLVTTMSFTTSHSFLLCNKLVKFIVPEGNTAFSTDPNGNSLLNKDGTSLIIANDEGTIPDSVTRIENYAFWQCNGIKTLNLNNVREWASYGLDGCTGITKITVSDSNTKFKVVENDTGYFLIDIDSSSSKKNRCVLGCQKEDAEWLTIDSDIADNIDSSAFANKDSVKKVEFKNSSNLTIYSRGFNNCKNLTDVKINLSSTRGVTLELYAFKDCTSLKNVSFHDGCWGTIMSYAFQGCTSLESIDIKKISSAYSESFEGCTSLTSFTAASAEPNLKKISENVFKNCTSLSNVNVPSLNEISTGAFENCFTLNTLKTADLERIGENAFKNSGITEFDFTAITTTDNITNADGRWNTNAFNGVHTTGIIKVSSQDIGEAIKSKYQTELSNWTIQVA